MTDAKKKEIIENWTYLLIGAKADLRKLPMNHKDRSAAEAQVTECEAKIAYFKNLPTVEDPVPTTKRLIAVGKLNKDITSVEEAMVSYARGNL